MHKNAIIMEANITIEDGPLEVWLTLDYGNRTGQGFGGFALHLPEEFAHHNLLYPAGHHLFRILQIAGVTTWKEVTGKAIRAQVEDGSIIGIGHITKEDWFYPAKDYQKLRRTNTPTRNAPAPEPNNPLQLEEGKCYIRRDRKVIGPLDLHTVFPFQDRSEGWSYTAEGRYTATGEIHPLDIIREATPEERQAATITP